MSKCIFVGHHLVNGGKYVNQLVRRVDYSAHYGQLSTRVSSNISYTNIRSLGNGLEVCNWSIVSNEYILYVSWHFRWCTFAIKPFFPVRTRVHSFLPKDSVYWWILLIYDLSPLSWLQWRGMTKLLGNHWPRNTFSHFCPCFSTFYSLHK